MKDFAFPRSICFVGNELFVSMSPRAILLFKQNGFCYVNEYIAPAGLPANVTNHGNCIWLTAA